MPRIEWTPGITFARYADRWADMAPHLGQLTDYARDCRTIVEFGLRGGVSTWAMLDGLPADGSLMAVDIDPEVLQMTPPWVIADPRLTIVIGDDLRVLLPERADMVMIDSSHLYDHTVAELTRAAGMSPRRILLHDYLYGGWCEGVRTAVDEFVEVGTYRIETVHESKWGLAVLVPA